MNSELGTNAGVISMGVLPVILIAGVAYLAYHVARCFPCVFGCSLHGFQVMSSS